MYDELVKRLRTATTLPVMNALCQDAADAVEELSKPRWIPVTERLPEENGRYLTLYPLKTRPIVWRHKVYEFSKDLVEIDAYDFNEHKPGFYGYDGEYGYYEDKDVTHWMPLPEPPKEETIIPAEEGE